MGYKMKIKKPLALDDQIHLDMHAVCESCGAVGAFVYYTGDKFCAKCLGITPFTISIRKEQNEQKNNLGNVTSRK